MSTNRQIDNLLVIIDKTGGAMSIGRHLFFPFAIMLILICLVNLLASCEREDMPGFNGDEPELPTGEPVTVNFTIGGTGFGEKDVVVRKAPFRQGSTWTVLSRQVVPDKMNTGRTGMDNRELEEVLYMSTTLTEDNAPVRLRSALEDARVRILAYTVAGSDTILTAVSDYEASSHGSLTPVGAAMTVPSGSYMFVAYSYNDTVPMPVMADTTANDIISKDLLWGKANQAVGAGNSTVFIELEHLFAKVTMNLTLDIPEAGSSIDGITNANISSYAPALIIKSGRLILNPPTLGNVPFSWEFSGSGNAWADSKPRYVYMNGQTSVTVQFSSVTIDGAPYSSNGSYTPITFPTPTPLEGGKSYTLTVHFTRGPGGCADILYINNDTLKIGRWGVDNIPLDSVLYFKFGSVVGLRPNPTTSTPSWNTNLIRFNPSTRSITAYHPNNSSHNHTAIANYNVAILNTLPNDNPSIMNISGSNYHFGTHILNGKGDPCQLVGLRGSQLRSLSAAQIDQLPGSGWRLPTAVENLDFARAPTGNGTSFSNNDLKYWDDTVSVRGVKGGWFPIPGALNATSGRTTRNTNLHGFLPALGRYVHNGELNGSAPVFNANGEGSYWSSDVAGVTTQGAANAWAMTFNMNTLTLQFSIPAANALPVRCVKVNP